MENRTLEFVYIPESVIEKINLAPNLGEYYIDNKIKSNDVLRVNRLICEPNGVLKWTIPDTKELVIFANQIIMNEPTSLQELCKIEFVTIFGENVNSAHDGANGVVQKTNQNNQTVLD